MGCYVDGQGRPKDACVLDVSDDWKIELFGRLSWMSIRVVQTNDAWR